MYMFSFHGKSWQGEYRSELAFGPIHAYIEKTSTVFANAVPDPGDEAFFRMAISSPKIDVGKFLALWRNELPEIQRCR